MAADIWGYSVMEEWEEGGDGGHAILIAIFHGENARAEAEAFAQEHAESLERDGQNVYRITGADDYEGDDVDVLVEPITADMVNPRG